MGADYKEKIRKLLALAQSPNEHEAKSAMLKARQLMAEHKLTEMDCVDAKKQEVKDIITDITCSKRWHPWIVLLSGVIGENYCCKAYRNHYKGKQMQYIGFIGLEDDVEICRTVFEYAVDCILSGEKQIRKENKGYDAKYVTRCADSYGYGYVNGIQEALDKQQEEEKQSEEGWGLVMTIPKEVEEYTKGFRSQQFDAKASERMNGSSFMQGFNDGQKFDPTRRLQEA